MIHNEDSRVKMPSILHLTRLGYEYLSLKEAEWNGENNIFTEICLASLVRINPDFEESEIKQCIDDMALTLENEDLGQAFYEKLIHQSGLKFIDFSNFENNTFHVVTELPCVNGEDSFRPDISLLINGIPLIFIEVKKPNNRDGVLAERERIDTRFRNKKFRRFANITQIMVFSNNMEYDDDSSQPIEGAFYATPSYEKNNFNYFREEASFDLKNLLKPEDDVLESMVLADNNLISIKHHPEFLTNKHPDTPTNRLSTSLFSKDRLAFLLKYAIAYVKGSRGIQKHIMRYPQVFATFAIKEKLQANVKKGIIWHTQGSGKTALAFYNVRHLTDYFQEKSIIPKFYFIVDRIDLLTQAKKEFSARGLIVHIINSRDEFAEEIKSSSAVHNSTGKPEITVVNIQKFKDDPHVVESQDYNISMQRVYFLDEVHRSYNPEGSFLANLSQSDTHAIKIGLTGTPLLGEDVNSRAIFGEYIHKYYYNASIADGYTLRLIREGIETNYKVQLEKALQEVEVSQGDLDKKELYSHKRFVEPMLDYIVEDFRKSRVTMNDDSIGGMVICDSSEQAKMMQELFGKKYAKADSSSTAENTSAEDAPATYAPASTERKKEQMPKTSALILHDIGSKQERKKWVEDFKDGKTDLLFVYNMLLTGFDAPRLKKLTLVA